MAKKKKSDLDIKLSNEMDEYEANIKNNLVAASKSNIDDKNTAIQLTSKQKAFIHAHFDGSSWIDSYKSAYNTEGMTKSSISVEAWKLRQNPKIQKYILEMENAYFGNDVATKNELLAKATRMLDDPDKEIQKWAMKYLADYHNLFNHAKEITVKGDKDNPIIHRIHQPIEELLKELDS